jgi:hypothetical protein
LVKTLKARIAFLVVVVLLLSRKEAAGPILSLALVVVMFASV